MRSRFILPYTAVTALSIHFHAFPSFQPLWVYRHRSGAAGHCKTRGWKGRVWKCREGPTQQAVARFVNDGSGFAPRLQSPCGLTPHYKPSQGSKAKCSGWEWHLAILGKSLQILAMGEPSMYCPNGANRRWCSSVIWIGLGLACLCRKALQQYLWCDIFCAAFLQKQKPMWRKHELESRETHFFNWIVVGLMFF